LFIAGIYRSDRIPTYLSLCRHTQLKAEVTVNSKFLKMTLALLTLLLVKPAMAFGDDPMPEPNHGWEYLKLDWSAGEIPPGACDHGVFVIDYMGNFADKSCDQVTKGVASAEDMTLFRQQVAGVYKDINHKLKCGDEVVEDYYPTFSLKVPGQKEKVVFSYGGSPTCRRSSVQNTESLEEGVSVIRGKYVDGEGQED
jgi:hypothetical protein